MQLVTLSARPGVLAETLRHVRHFMPWVDHVVVVAPEWLAPSFDAAGDIKVVTDEELTGRATAAMAGYDHTAYNFALRGALSRHDAIADEFLMSDDDYRPIKPIAPSFFRTDGRDRCFCFYDLDSWPGNATPFDAGQHNSRELLAYLGHERLAYASHMPQLIRKGHLAEAAEIAARLVGPDLPLDEWAVYFNIARARHRDDFCEPEPFQTLAWPQFPNEWPWWIRPAELSFENFYPALYEPGALFAGLTTDLDPSTAERANVEKALRWADFARHSSHLRFPGGVANPWTGSVPRRLAFGVLRRVQQAHRYVALDERSRISELQGTVARLEAEVTQLRRDRG